MRAETIDLPPPLPERDNVSTLYEPARCKSCGHCWLLNTRQLNTWDPLCPSCDSPHIECIGD